MADSLDIFSLSASDFNAYLQEAAQYSEPSQIDFLRREYRKRNSLSGFLDTSGEAGLEGKNVSSMLPIAGPAGMSLLDAFKGGKLQTRFKDYITDALGALVGGIENPGMAAKGLLTDDEMLGASMQTAGTAMLGGGAAVNTMRPSGDGLLASNMPAMKSQSLPEPRNQAEANAKAILELRAQGRANEVTNDMMAAADPQYMFNNTPLDMSENARMARASELGFDINAPLYHGTPEVDFNEFDPEKFAAYGDPGLRGVGVYSSDSDGIANQYAGRPRFDKTVDTGDVLQPARVSEDLLRRGVIPMFSRAQSRVNINDLPLLERAALSGKSGFDVNNALPDNDGVKKTYTSVNPSSEFVDFNPASIRSRFARFDPEFSDLSNLSAANANASVGALVLSQHARAKPELADILAQNGVDPANINAAPIQSVQAALETATARQILDPRSANSILQGFARPELEDFYANASKSAGAAGLLASDAAGFNVFHGTPHDFPPAMRVYDKQTDEAAIYSKDDAAFQGLLSSQPDRFDVLDENPLGLFDLAKINTGEGAQSYSRGLYFAENEKVAKEYRDMLTRSVDVNGKPFIRGNQHFDDALDNEDLADNLGATGGNLEKAISDTEAFKQEMLDFGNQEAADIYQKEIDDLIALRGKVTINENKGRMYEAKIKADPATFIDWDAPYSKQPQNVKDAFKSIATYVTDDGSVAPTPLLDQMTGGDLLELYEAQIKKYGSSIPSDEMMRRNLSSDGVPGVKFFDQHSRNTAGGELVGIEKTDDGYRAKIKLDRPKGPFAHTPRRPSLTKSKPYKTKAEAEEWAQSKINENSRNFVIYDDKLIDIQRAYANANPLAGLLAMQQPQQSENRGLLQ